MLKFKYGVIIYFVHMMAVLSSLRCHLGTEVIVRSKVTPSTLIQRSDLNMNTVHRFAGILNS